MPTAAATRCPGPGNPAAPRSCTPGEDPSLICRADSELSAQALRACPEPGQLPRAVIRQSVKPCARDPPEALGLWDPGAPRSCSA